jgi:hypothetical protein
MAASFSRGGGYAISTTSGDTTCPGSCLRRASVPEPPRYDRPAWPDLTATGSSRVENALAHHCQRAPGAAGIATEASRCHAGTIEHETPCNLPPGRTMNPETGLPRRTMSPHRPRPSWLAWLTRHPGDRSRSPADSFRRRTRNGDAAEPPRLHSAGGWLVRSRWRCRGSCSGESSGGSRACAQRSWRDANPSYTGSRKRSTNPTVLVRLFSDRIVARRVRGN